MPAGPREEVAERPGQARHQEERSGVHMPAVGQQPVRHVLGPGGRQAAGGGEDGAVVAPGEDGGERGGPFRVGGQRGDVHAALGQRRTDEGARGVVTDPPGERHAQPQPRRSAGRDRGRTAHQEACRGDESLALPVFQGGRDGTDHHVGVGVADHEEVEGAGHGYLRGGSLMKGRYGREGRGGRATPSTRSTSATG